VNVVFSATTSVELNPFIARWTNAPHLAALPFGASCLASLEMPEKLLRLTVAHWIHGPGNQPREAQSFICVLSKLSTCATRGA
jgi:hypothetical protein